MQRPTIAIVGCGRAGGALGLALQRAGYVIATAWSRTAAGRARAEALLGVPCPADPAQAVRGVDLAVLAVPDDALEPLAVQLAGDLPEPHPRRVVHVSGGSSVGVLDPLARAGVAVGCMHPLQTLPDAHRGSVALRGAAVAITCEDADAEALQALACAWGGRPFRLPDADKPLYHAAAVFTSNYLVACMWSATRLLESLGVGPAHELIGPLARASVDNVVASGPQAAITGPVVRGDAGVILRHLEALGSGPVADGYAAMARLTADLAGVDAPELLQALEVGG